MDVILNRGRMEQVDFLRYLRAYVYEKGRLNEEVCRRLRERESVRGALRIVWRNTKM